MNQENLIRHCLETECEFCQVCSPELANCSYDLNLVGNHGKSPFALETGRVCRYKLPVEPKPDFFDEKTLRMQPELYDETNVLVVPKLPNSEVIKQNFERFPEGCF